MHKIILLIIAIFTFHFGNIVHAMEMVVSGESNFGFQEKEENNFFVLKYQGKTILSREGTKSNWHMYSNKELIGQNQYGCGQGQYISLSGKGGKEVDEKLQQHCLAKEMSEIYYISRNSGRYILIGVGIKYGDYSRGVFEETYLFDTRSKKLLNIGKFSESSEAPAIRIIEGSSAIYIVSGEITLIDKKLTKILGYISPTIGSLYGCKQPDDYNLKRYCIDIESIYPKTDELSSVWIQNIYFLRNKKLKIYIEGRATEEKFEQIISLSGFF